MKWKYVLTPLSELRPQEKNPRRISREQKDQLKKSIDSFGLAEPICISHDNRIIGGHQRYYILKSMGTKEIECYKAQEEMTEAQIDELTIRLNKNSGSFDFDLLANSYDPMDLVKWGFEMDDLHLESIPEQLDKPTLCQLTAKFENEDDLRQAETQIAAIIDLYASASYKVKVK